MMAHPSHVSPRLLQQALATKLRLSPLPQLLCQAFILCMLARRSNLRIWHNISARVRLLEVVTGNGEERRPGSLLLRVQNSETSQDWYSSTKDEPWRSPCGLFSQIANLLLII